MGEFTCRDCGRAFSVPAAALARYPGWTPRQCRSCREAGLRGAVSSPGGGNGDGDPQSGIFTDGSCQGNPGPGGWGAVFVRDGKVVEERHGFEPQTTNNRMEWEAMLAGLEMAPEDEPVTIYSDSQLVVRTLNEWAKDWEARGWRRKSGPVENLDLVRRAWELKRQRPLARVEWVRGHAASRWNAYADRLATRHLREGGDG
nr:ribonuclease H [Tepidiforma sp.]